MTLNKKGFTLVELIVVVGMIMVIIAAMSVSVSGAQERARVQKATAEVKIITQAILAYENEKDHELQPMSKEVCNRSSLGFLLGNETSKTGNKIPVLLMAALSSGGDMLDPWGHPYRVTIKRRTPSKIDAMKGAMSTGAYLPNFYRLGEGER